jgi:uncharacterized membrane protein YphA (DoxX/SURF4 family)
MKYLIKFSQWGVGLLFIFSGIVKANDPLGFSYKLDEYFVEFGMNWEWLMSLALPMSIFLVIFEVALGVALLVSYKSKIVNWLLLLLIVFFTILTGASAIFDIVRSCGCFGDAIPLTAYQSFYKDLILLFFILILFFNKDKIDAKDSLSPADYIFMGLGLATLLYFSSNMAWFFPFIFAFVILLIFIVLKMKLGEKSADISTILGTTAIILFTLHCYYNLPVKDFRPYAIGKSIPAQMKLPEGAQPDVFETKLVYENIASGETKEMTQDEYMSLKLWEDSTWKWKSTDSKLIKEGDKAKITDFAITDFDNNDYTYDFLDEEAPILVFISSKINKVNKNAFQKINPLVEAAFAKGYYAIGLTASSYNQVDEFRHDVQAMFDYYQVDEITLKTIVRSNPGLILLKKGTILGKWHHRNIPEISEIEELLK